MAGLTVAITGPTGEIGRATMRALERSREVGRIDRDGATAVRSPATGGSARNTGRETFSTGTR